jgi:hypothetical protein
MGAVAAVALTAWICQPEPPAPAAAPAPADWPAALSEMHAPVNPADARQQALLNANAGKPGDPDLGTAYDGINVRYFSGGLPEIPVRWERALADIGPLVGPGVTLQGLFGHAGTHRLILLNPILQTDAPALERTLCHEVVHAYLSSIGDEHAGHGQTFQAVLQRLSTEGAFQGIPADAAERAGLKAWLDAESARIDAERKDLDGIDSEIRQTSADLDRAIAEFNGRADRPQAEADGLETRRQQFNQRVLEVNARLARDREDLAHFNAEVDRYNLMMAYPDGLDEQSLMRAKPTLAAPGRR